MSLFVQVSDKHVTAGTAVFSDAFDDGESGLRCTLHNYDLPCSELSNQVTTGSRKVFAEFQGLPYLYP